MTWLLRSLGVAPGIGNIVAQQRYTTGSSGIPGTAVMHYYHPNHRGDTAYLTDASGVKVASYVYDAFGRLLTDNGSPITDYRFSGKEWDPDAQLYYFGFRWYDPDTGTWTTKDPLSIVGGINMYLFAHNAPINRVDIFGLYPVPYGNELKPIFKNYDVTEVDIKRKSQGPIPSSKGAAYTHPSRPKEVFLNDQDYDLLKTFQGHFPTLSDLKTCGGGIRHSILEELLHELAHLEQFNYINDEDLFMQMYDVNKQPFEDAADARAARIIDNIPRY